MRALGACRGHGPKGRDGITNVPTHAMLRLGSHNLGINFTDVDKKRAGERRVLPTIRAITADLFSRLPNVPELLRDLVRGRGRRGR